MVSEACRRAQEKKEYIVKTLDPILEEMVSDTLAEMPKVGLRKSPRAHGGQLGSKSSHKPMVP